jgi:uncharacterized protein YbjQ (UPF0145 family)
MNGGVYRANHICPHCFFEHEGGKRSRAKTAAAPIQAAPQETPAPAKVIKTKPVDKASEYIVTEHDEMPTEASAASAPEIEAKADITQEMDAVTEMATPEPAPAKAAKTSGNGEANTVLTTKPQAEQTVLAVMGPVSAECVLSIALTPDLFEDGKFIGRKSEKVRAALKQGKLNALEQLREAAQSQDANMVTDVTVKNGMKMVGDDTAKITVSATGNAIVAELESCEA